MRKLQFIFLISITMICPKLKSQSFTIYRGDTINRIDKNGLKYGHWVYFKDFERNINRSIVDTLNPRITSDCYYIKILLSSDMINSIEEDDFFGEKLGTGHIILKDSTRISYYSKYLNYFSVLDGYEIYYNPNIDDTCELWSIDLYSKGSFISSQKFSAGVPTEFIRSYKHSEDKYLGADPYVYKREIYLKNGLYKTIFYPDKKLSISSNYISFYSTIGTSDTASINMTSNSDDTLLVKVVTSCNFISLDKNLNLFKNYIKINPKETIQLKIIFAPIGMSYYTYENEIIFLDQFNSQIGKATLFCLGFHLSMKKSTNKEFHINKTEISNDGFIIDLCSFKNYNFAEIKDINGKIMKTLNIPLDLPCLGQIPVKEYPIGTYFLTFYGNKVHDLIYKLIIE